MNRHRPHPGRPLALAALLTLAAILTPTPALAGAHAAVDFDLGAPIGQRSLRYATGLGARVGWRFDLGPVWLQPEAGASFVTFKEAIVGHIVFQPLDVPRVLGGARLGLSRTGVVQPAVFGHAGIGWYENKARGPAAEAGLALDLAVVPHFTFGAQLACNFLAVTLPQHVATTIVTAAGPVAVASPSSSSSLQWISAGIHGGFTF